MKRWLTPLLAGLFVTAAPAWAMAQTTTYVPEGDIKVNEAELALQEGRMDGMLALSASFSMASNSNVVGQSDGISLLVGLGLIGGLDYLRGKYEMRNTLSLNEAFSRTPVIDEFIKTNDAIEIENLHNYFLLSWFGVFGRLDAKTNLFKSEDIRTDPVSYVLVGDDGERSEIVTSERLLLNEAFAPFTLSESVGVFAQPVRNDAFTLMTRVGFGARQTFADGVRVVQDDDDTETIEVTELDNVIQAGAEGFVGVRGGTKDGRATYNVGTSIMIPFLNNDDQDRSATELTRLAAEAQVTFGVFEWLNLVYNFKAIKDPQLLDETQLQNNLVLTFQYTLLERSTAKPTDVSEVVKAQAAAAAAENKAKLAEERAAEAEARAEAAEQQLEEQKNSPDPQPAPEPAPEPLP